MTEVRDQKSEVRRLWSVVIKAAPLSSLLLALCTFGALLFALCSSVNAQQRDRMWRIGYIGNAVSTSEDSLRPFRERLRELGYFEGQNITIESRYWEGQVERLPNIASELVRLNCDVIVISGTEAAQVAKKSIKTVPVVMAFGADAVRRGVVGDLAHPGGNITGLTSINAELFGKQLELLKEIIPKLERVAFFWSPTNPDGEHQAKEAEIAGRSLRLQILSMRLSQADDIDAAFQTAIKKRARALLVSGGGFFAFHQKRIIDLAVKTKMPTVYGNPRYVEAGGLMTYSFDRNEQFRRSAEYVDKILKGAKPADLPVERPKKIELVINLQAAKQIALTIPQSVLYRADRVIK